MSTARKQLYQEVLEITQNNQTNDLTGSLKSVLIKYRVQAKSPDVATEKGSARKKLIEKLHDEFKISSKLKLAARVENVLSGFRMQLKKNFTSQKTDKTPCLESKSSLETAKKGRKKSGLAIQLKKKAHKSNKNIAPLAGGPKRRASSRGKCPKCNSMGVVLAQSSGGDGYFSCIYCGFQAYHTQPNSELNWPLAAELLGRCFDEGEGRK